MDKAKQWVALAVAAALLLAGGGWSLLVQPERDEAAALREQTEVTQAQNAQLETQLEVLRTKAAGLPQQKADLAEVAARIPDEPALPALVRALTAAGRAAGIELTSITPGVAVPVTPAGETEPAAGAPAGLTAVPVVLQVTGDFYGLAQFVAGLEDLPRALRVTGLTLRDAADTGGRQLTSTIATSVYVSGADPAAAGSGAPAAAAATPADPAAAVPTPADPTAGAATAGASAAPSDPVS